MENFIKIGKDLGLEGDKLLQFAEKKEAEAIEREERNKERELRKLEIEAEKKRLEADAENKRIEADAENKRLEAVEAEKRRAHELEMKRLELNVATPGTPQEPRSDQSARAPKLPAFNENTDKMDAYLERFERFAKNNKWQEDVWATRLSALLTGKSLEFYSRLSREEADDYRKLKLALLRHYDYTEEGYRRKFRGCKPEEGETPALFIERIKSYLEKWIETAGLQKEYEALRDLFIKEQTLNACPRELAAHLREQKDQSLQALADAAKRYLEAHNTKFAHKTQRAYVEERSEESSGGRGGASNQPICFACGSQGHRAARCPFRQPPRDGNFKRQEYPGKKSTPSPQHKAASIVMPAEETSERKHCSLEQIEEFRRDGQIPVGNGSFLPLSSLVLPDKEEANVPVCEGRVGDTPVRVLRDTGCSSIVVKEDLVPEEDKLKEYATLILADGTVRIFQRAMVDVYTPYLCGRVKAFCMKTPVYDLIIGNVEGVRNVDAPDPHWDAERCAVTTRRQAKTEGQTIPLKVAEEVDLAVINPEKLKELQEADPTLHRCRDKEEPVMMRGKEITFVTRKGILYRQCETQADEKPVLQVVVPGCLRGQIMQLAHDSILGAHLGTGKTLSRIQAVFYWPDMGGDVARFCRSCDICQRTISKGRIPKVPLQKMPLIDQPFKRVAVDLVGPISPPSENGHQYILTLVDYATRYPEAIALKRIDTPTVAEALVDMFSRLGIPEEILSDLGTQFVSECMEEVNRLLSIRHLTTTPYHPMCNGLVERFNGTLKAMLKKLCAEQPRQWHRFINALLFAYREVPQESTGFSPFELLYGRTVRGPMHILKELWTENVDVPETKTSYQYVFELREKLEATLELARAELEKAQNKGKHHYDCKAKPRKFRTGDKVLLLLPTDNNKLLMQWKGPYVIQEVVGPNNYKVKVGRGLKTYHANLLKKYVDREEQSTPEKAATACSAADESCIDQDIFELNEIEHKEGPDDINFGQNLSVEQHRQVKRLVREFEDRFTPRPGMTDIVQHQVKLTSNTPVHCKPYRLPYATRQELKKDIKEMLDLGIIRESKSPYASPVVIVKKSDGSNRVCVDYRKLNKLTVFDPEPMPTAEELFQKTGNDKFFSKIDLSKGYWQIKVAEEDIPKTAFVTPDGHWEFLRMPFGMVNSGATLKRGLSRILKDVDNVLFYWDDILVHTPSWEDHIKTLRELFQRLKKADLTIRPSKCILGTDNVDFIGHRLSEGVKGLHDDNVRKIMEAARPTTKKQVRAFMGLANYYREYVPNFAAVTVPLTDLLKKGQPNAVKWEEPQERAFQTVRILLTRRPILRLPDPKRTFILRTDASNDGVGAVLMQVHDGKPYPVSYGSKKLTAAERNYSTIEKECLAIVWGVKKFELYLQGVPFVLQTDHQPLNYLNSAKFINSRVMRWAMYLQNFNIKLECIKGSENVGADYMSRTV